MLVQLCVFVWVWVFFVDLSVSVCVRERPRRCLGVRLRAGEWVGMLVSVCMCAWERPLVCVCVRDGLCVFVITHVRRCACLCIDVWAFVSMSMCACLCLCECVCVFVCVGECAWVCVCVCVCVCERERPRRFARVLLSSCFLQKQIVIDTDRLFMKSTDGANSIETKWSQLDRFYEEGKRDRFFWTTNLFLNWTFCLHSAALGSNDNATLWSTHYRWITHLTRCCLVTFRRFSRQANLSQVVPELRSCV